MTTPTGNQGQQPPPIFPDGPGPAPDAPVQSARNGLGWAALGVGIGAVIFGVFFFPLGLLLALAGIGLAIPGLRRSGRREATNGVAAGLGLALSVLGLLVAIGVGVFFGWLSNEVKDCSDPSLSEVEVQRCVQDRLRN
ncbi:MAG: hypothetical protein ACRDV1_08910 [Actinomycetes bacterium]